MLTGQQNYPSGRGGAPSVHVHSIREKTEPGLQVHRGRANSLLEVKLGCTARPGHVSVPAGKHSY